MTKLPNLVCKENHAVLSTASNHLRNIPNRRSNDAEDVPGYTDKKLSDRLFVSSRFDLYNEKKVLHVLRPFQTYRIFQDRASKMLDRGGYLRFSVIPRHQTRACNRRVSKRSRRQQGTAREFSSPSQFHGCCRADLPCWPEDSGDRSKMIHSEWVPLGHCRPQQGFHYGLGWGKWEVGSGKWERGGNLHSLK